MEVWVFAGARGIVLFLEQSRIQDISVCFMLGPFVLQKVVYQDL